MRAEHPTNSSTIRGLNCNSFFYLRLQRGFTLIELLIVIFIIAIMASMLFPSLARARRSAKVAVCINNARQINSTLFHHLKDNNNKTPSNTFRGHTTNSSAPAHGWVGIKTKKHPWEYRSLNIYLGIKDSRSDVSLPVARCPLDNYTPYGVSTFATYGQSYIGNARVSGVGLNNGSEGIFISSISTSASKMVTLPEMGGFHFAFGFGPLWGYSWHGSSKYSLGFLDGHILNTKIDSGQRVGKNYSFDKNQ